MAGQVLHLLQVFRFFQIFKIEISRFLSIILSFLINFTLQFFVVSRWFLFSLCFSGRWQLRRRSLPRLGGVVYGRQPLEFSTPIRPPSLYLFRAPHSLSFSLTHFCFWRCWKIEKKGVRDVEREVRLGSSLPSPLLSTEPSFGSVRRPSFVATANLLPPPFLPYCSARAAISSRLLFNGGAPVLLLLRSAPE